MYNCHFVVQQKLTHCKSTKLHLKLLIKNITEKQSYNSRIGVQFYKG